MNRTKKNGPPVHDQRAAHRWGWAGEALKVMEEVTGQKWSRPGLRTVATRINAVERDPDEYHYRFDLLALTAWAQKQNKLTSAAVRLSDVARRAGRSYPGMVLILKREGIIHVTCKGRAVISKAVANKLLRKYRRPEATSSHGS